MNKQAIVNQILRNCTLDPSVEHGIAFAPANIALCKYWGKRNLELHLPTTSSLSISLGNFGAKTTLYLQEKMSNNDVVIVNGQTVNTESTFVKNLSAFLDLFRPAPTLFFRVETEMNIPIGAGLASSACGFAALVGALNQLYDWQLSSSSLSILARLGSGSAARSFWHGFVEWHRGTQKNGMDSFAIPLHQKWPDLRIGLLIFNETQKSISSRNAMQNTMLTSDFYKLWPKKSALDLSLLKKAIEQQDFLALGKTAESNALAMHALMLTSSPAFFYSQPETIAAMYEIWHYRKLGLLLFFTQDAGPNLKLLFLEQDCEAVRKAFPTVKIIAPFSMHTEALQ
jgi:diphosphomevalonate decarboxylase